MKSLGQWLLTFLKSQSTFDYKINSRNTKIKNVHNKVKNLYMSNKNIYNRKLLHYYFIGMVNQRCPWPRGRGLGGSTLINYMIYTRGNRADFDKWAQNGNPGWSYDEVLPFYLMSERSTLKYKDRDFHNYDGSLNVEDIRYSTPIRESFIAGGRERGK